MVREVRKGPFCEQWETTEAGSPMCYQPAVVDVYNAAETGEWEWSCARHVAGRPTRHLTKWEEKWQ